MYLKNLSLRKLIFIFLTGVFLIIVMLACQGEKSSSDNNKFNQTVSNLVKARQTLTKISLVTKTFGTLTGEEAYEIQDMLATELSKEFGPVAGYKIGYADSSALKQNNIDVPAYGPFFACFLLFLPSRQKFIRKSNICFQYRIQITMPKKPG